MWEISKQNNLPVYQQIMTLISSLVDDGTLLPGEKLPSERQLATILDVNRSTVIHALDELVSTGVIIRKRGSGTFINDGKWGVKKEPAVNWGAYLSHSAFDRVDPYMQIVGAILSLQSEDYIDAYSGELSYNLIPNLDIPAITWQTFIREEQKEDALGYFQLRQKICEEVASSSNTLISPEQLLLTNGAQQALFLILQVLLQPGDAVAIENPSFLYSLPIFQAAGIRLYGIPVDREGMKVELLEKEILHHRIKMVITNPTFQNPTGTVMSVKRRQLLVDVCQRYRIPIVEDDVFGQLNFGQSKQIDTLKSMDPTNVIYIGSLSKILGSTTKIGWVSAPIRVIRKIADARIEMDVGMSIFPQVLAYYALSNPSYHEQLKQLNSELQEQANEFVTQLHQEIGQSFTCQEPRGGQYIWVEYLQGPIGPKEMNFLVEKKLLCAPSYIFGLRSPFLRFNFARLSLEEIPKVISILKEAVDHWLEDEKKESIQ